MSNWKMCDSCRQMIESEKSNYHCLWINRAEQYHLCPKCYDEMMLIIFKKVIAPGGVCDCWHDQGDRKECWGTPERSVCTCGGDKNKCDFYGG